MLLSNQFALANTYWMSLSVLFVLRQLWLVIYFFLAVLRNYHVFCLILSFAHNSSTHASLRNFISFFENSAVICLFSISMEQTKSSTNIPSLFFALQHASFTVKAYSNSINGYHPFALCLVSICRISFPFLFLCHAISYLIWQFFNKTFHFFTLARKVVYFAFKCLELNHSTFHFSRLSPRGRQSQAKGLSAGWPSSSSAIEIEEKRVHRKANGRQKKSERDVKENF